MLSSLKVAKMFIAFKRKKERKLARKFNLSYCYIDGIISFNNKRFKEFISDIYPKELTVSETIDFSSVSSYFGLLFTRDKSNNITTKLFESMIYLALTLWTLPLCQAIFHQHQPMVSLHLTSFATPVTGDPAYILKC